MTSVKLGLVCGVAFGALAVVTMLPMQFADKRAALLSAFASRFAIGFLACTVTLALPGWAIGALVGLLVSLPNAIVTGVYPPILGVGVLGGAVIGGIRDRVLH